MAGERSVLVSGASSGIGRATAGRLSAAGWRVLAPEDLDVTDEGSIERARELVARAGDGKLDALVNNAGIAVGGPLESVPISDLRRILEVNVTGQVALTQALLPLLRPAAGRVVFVGSLGGRVAFPYAGPYHASKFAIEAIGDSLRAELLDQPVSVSVIEPGRIETPIWAKAIDQVSALRDSLRGEARELYAGPLAGFAEKLDAAGRSGADPELVAERIAKALESGRPRARYRVGRGVGTLILLKAIAPTGAFDRLLRRVVG